MSQKILNVDYETDSENELIEALGNAWFQMVILWVLSVTVLSGVVVGVEIWRWPVAVAVPIAAWWLGTWYGRFNAQEDGTNGHL